MLILMLNESSDPRRLVVISAGSVEHRAGPDRPATRGLTVYRSAPRPLPVLPLGMESLAQFAASAGACFEADDSTALFTDERGFARPYMGTRNLGAYQFDGDYIFSSGNEVTP